MRLWSVHPSVLDRVGLVALWREGLLAQAVLRGRTRGYRHHPQLIRFRETGAPVSTLASYLDEVWVEAERRGYSFDRARLARRRRDGYQMTLTRGQLTFEWMHLRAKLKARDAGWLQTISAAVLPRPHPIFRLTAGEKEEWERG